MTEPGSDPAPSDLFLQAPAGARRPHPLALTFKRGLDFVVAATSIFLLLPLMLFVAGTIWALDRGPPVVRETSLGCGGRTFERLRFRTAGPGSEPPSGIPDKQVASAGVERMTAFGQVLSRTSMDELPTLLNVLRGEMSLVGPRPIPKGAARCGSDIDARLSTPPGLTGAWQVEGGRGATDTERAALDLDYARRWSLRRDFAIMLRGVATAFVRRDRA